MPITVLNNPFHDMAEVTAKLYPTLDVTVSLYPESAPKSCFGALKISENDGLHIFVDTLSLDLDTALDTLAHELAHAVCQQFELCEFQENYDHKQAWREVYCAISRAYAEKIGAEWNDDEFYARMENDWDAEHAPEDQGIYVSRAMLSDLYADILGSHENLKEVLEPQFERFDKRLFGG